MTFAVVPQNEALAAVAVRHEQVECTLAVEVRPYDGCCPFCQEGFAVGKTALTVVQTDRTRSGPFGAFAGLAVHDFRIAVELRMKSCVAPDFSPGKRVFKSARTRR